MGDLRLLIAVVTASTFALITPPAHAQSRERWDTCVRDYWAQQDHATPALGISAPEAETLIGNIASGIGLRSDTIVIIPCSRINRAYAYYSGGEIEGVRSGEYMFYNEQWVREVVGQDRVQAIALFGHELGHLLNRDFLQPRVNLPRHQLETDADEFAGCAVAASGGEWGGVEDLFSRLRGEAEGAYPNRLQSLEAARRGFERCARAPQHTTSAPQTVSPTEQPVSGVWTVVVNCPNGATVQELDAQFLAGRYDRRFEGQHSGQTHLSMYQVSPSEIRVTGHVTFDAGHILPVDGRGTGLDGSYSGVASFGASANCPFNAMRR